MKNYNTQSYVEDIRNGLDEIEQEYVETTYALEDIRTQLDYAIEEAFSVKDQLADADQDSAKIIELMRYLDTISDLLKGIDY